MEHIEHYNGYELDITWGEGFSSDGMIFFYRISVPSSDKNRLPRHVLSGSLTTSPFSQAMRLVRMEADKKRDSEKRTLLGMIEFIERVLTSNQKRHIV